MIKTMMVNGAQGNPEPAEEENVAGRLAVPTNHQHLFIHQLGSLSKFLSETKNSCKILKKE
jgi:hypothetical protein